MMKAGKERIFIIGSRGRVHWCGTHGPHRPLPHVAVVCSGYWACVVLCYVVEQSYVEGACVVCVCYDLRVPRLFCAPRAFGPVRL